MLHAVVVLSPLYECVEPRYQKMEQHCCEVKRGRFVRGYGVQDHTPRIVVASEAPKMKCPYRPPSYGVATLSLEKTSQQYLQILQGHEEPSNGISNHYPG